MGDVKHCGDTAQQAEHRADREIDFAADNHQHHAAGQDAGDRHLAQQVGEIARRDESAFGFPAEECPDDGNRNQQGHDLVLPEQLLDIDRTRIDRTHSRIHVRIHIISSMVADAAVASRCET